MNINLNYFLCILANRPNVVERKDSGNGGGGRRAHPLNSGPLSDRTHNADNDQKPNK